MSDKKKLRITNIKVEMAKHDVKGSEIREELNWKSPQYLSEILRDKCYVSDAQLDRIESAIKKISESKKAKEAA